MKIQLSLRNILPLLLTCAWAASAQITLTGTEYVETFDHLSAGLPPGWSVRTNATASDLGVAAAFTSSPTNWAASSGQFANYASTLSNAGTNLLGGETPTNQAACTNRCLGIRQTGSFGDPGAAFVVQLENTAGFTGLELSLDANLLNVQGRSTLWTIDYGIGSAPEGFTAANTITDPGAFGATRRTVSFGGALDNLNEPVWIRVVALAASSGSGSRDTFGIDNFRLTYQAAGTLAPIPLKISSSAGQIVIRWDNPAFSLQSAPAMDGPYTTVPGAGSPYSAAISGAQKYFRLKGN